MPITQNGFVARRFSDVLDEINQDLLTNLASDLDTSPETVIGLISNIFAEAISDQEDLAQAVADSFNLDKAEGKYLEDLGALSGLSRLEPAPTQGVLEVTASEGTSIPGGSQFSTFDNKNFLSVGSTVITQENCLKVSATPQGVDTAVDGTQYGVTINGFNFSVGKTTGDTAEDIVSRLIDDISGSNPYVSAYSDNNNPKRITLETFYESVPNDIQFNELFQVTSVTGLVNIESTVNGPVTVLKGEVTNSQVGGVFSVTNPNNLVTGRNTETDEEFRARQQESFGLSGNTTLPNILARLRQVDGVVSAAILENASASPDSNLGLPPNSYECVVVGGSNTDIASVLFDSKPAGIETYGDISTSVPYDGDLYTVRFSRPQPKYVWVKVEYTPYNEERLPDNSDEAIKQAILDYVSQLGPDEDLIPKRLYGPIYRNVSGIEDINILLATSEDLGTPPDPGDYITTSIQAGVKEFIQLSADRIDTLLF